MEIDIKKKLVKNWFKVLQDMICFEIEEIEKNKKKFNLNQIIWKKTKKKMKVGANIEF